MKNAAISFKGKTAFNAQFDDIYFNTDKPWCESEYVFAKGLDEIGTSKIASSSLKRALARG